MQSSDSFERIIGLAGEGGGLDLFCCVTNGVARFAWDRIWQMPDADGEPQKTPGWKERDYPTISDSFDAAPGYWTWLAPSFVHADHRAAVWQIVSERLTKSRLRPGQLHDAIARWKRVCRVA